MTPTDDPTRPLPLLRSLADDIIAHLPPESRPATRRGWAAETVRVALHSSGFRVVLLYRLAHSARPKFGPAGRLASGFISSMSRHAYGCSIASTARLHGGLILPHPQGIVVGPGVVVGPRAWIFQNATLGGVPGRDGGPCVGADARIYSGAVLAGPIRVGDNVMVGANAVVSRDVPDRTAVRAAAVEYAPLPDRFLVEDGPGQGGV